MSIFVLGVYDASASASVIAARRVAIIRRCAEAELPPPRFDTPDFLNATIVACEARSTKKRVWLVGSLYDLRAPQDEGERDRGFSDEEWREGWLAYLAEESLAWLSVDAKSTVETTSLSRVSVIRSYRRAWRSLMRLLAQARSRRSKDERSAEPRYTSGRPPYGYRAKEGCLTQDAAPVLAKVRRVYELIRNQASVSRVAAIMREEEAERPKKERKFWDTVKIRRLLSHAPLYCLGEYRSGKATKRAPELAFLPPTWVSTTPSRKETMALKAETKGALSETKGPVRETRSPGAVSPRPRSGTVQASASVPPPH